MGPASDRVMDRQADLPHESSGDESASVALVASESPNLSPRVSSTAGGGLPRQALIDTLRNQVEGIVPRAFTVRSPTPALTPTVGERAPACSFSFGPSWTLGAAEIDGFLPWQGLSTHGLHELKPAAPGDAAAAQVLAMALLARRLEPEEARHKSLLWVAPWRDIAEGGWPYGPGLRQLGLDPARLILVETRRDSEALWAIEEGMRSGALAGVLGSVSRLSLTAARRLALAAATYETPGLILTPAALPGLPVAMSRWRIAASAGAPHPLAPALPGRLRFTLALERCRGRECGHSWIVEWSDASFRFRVAAPLADRASRPGVARRRAG